MDTLKIGSFNTKDNNTNRHGGIRVDGISNADILASQIKENQFDLLGTQELTIKYVNELVLRLGNYKFYGGYRYGNVLLKMPYNENNNIITNKNVLFEETVWLPWIPNNFKDLKMSITKMSIMPRIATIIVVQDESFGKICMINTHLDYQVPSVQIRQLSSLKKLVEKYQQQYPVILTGDFNMEIGDKKFDKFISDMKNNGIFHVQTDKNTYCGKNGDGKIIDHIFIPQNWNVENVGVLDSNGTSDHKAIYVETSIKHK